MKRGVIPLAEEALHQLVGTALTDGDFCRRLLSQPREILGSFDLSPEEIAAIMRIKARSLEEFSRELNSWLEEQHALNGHRSRAPHRNGEGRSL